MGTCTNSSHCGRAEGRRMGRLLNVYILLLARMRWANHTVGVQPEGAFLVLPPLCEWYRHEKSHMQMKEAVIMGGKVTSPWERFVEFGKICTLNKGWDYKDLIVQMQIILLEMVDLETPWVMQIWSVSCSLGHRYYTFDKCGWLHIALLFPAVALPVWRTPVTIPLMASSNWLELSAVVGTCFCYYFSCFSLLPKTVQPTRNG